MARVKFSALLSEINGSVGGSTFQRSAYGYSLRNKPIPVNKPTILNQAIRQAFFQASRTWSLMSDVDRIYWRNAVEYYLPRSRNNKNSYLSAYSYFMKIAPLCFFLNVPLSGFTALLPALPELTFYRVGNEGTYMEVAYNNTSVNVYPLVIEISRPFTSQVKFNSKGLRLITASFNDNSATFDSSYINTFGALAPVGSWVNIRVRIIGYNSPYVALLFEGCTQVIDIS